MPARDVPSSGFVDPLDGFLPPSPSRPCFMPAALMGLCAPSELSPLAGGCAFPRSPNPRTVFPSGYTTLLAQQGRPREGRGFWVQTRASVLWPDGRTINPPPAGCSHGVLPLRAHQRMSCPGFRPVLLPRAFRCVAPENDASRRHLGVSIDTRLITTSLPDKPTLVATTLSGFCAACDQTCIQELSRPGLLFRLAAFGRITAAVRRS